MDFFVVYLDSGRKVGTCVVDYPEYDIVGIATRARATHPGIDVRCIISRTDGPDIPLSSGCIRST